MIQRHHFAFGSFPAVLLSSAALAVALPAVGFAQNAAPAGEEARPAPPPPPATQGNEIVITATKREQTLQSVPVAVTVTTATTLQRAVIRDVQDLATVVPALRVEQEQSPANTNFEIRGFGNGANNAGIEPSVGVFIDGVYRSRSSAALSDFPDVSRIEVLRGPQSTLFGKNASAGIISITTQEPQFQTHGSVEASYENYHGVVAKASLTGPVTQDLAYSLAVGLDERDGYIHDLATGNTLNNRNRWFVRGQALWKPSAEFRLRLIADFDQIDERCCAVVSLRQGPAAQFIAALGGQTSDPAAPFHDTTSNNFDPTNNIKNYGFSGQADYDLGAFKLTSITAYRRKNTLSNEDVDFSSADLIGGNAQQQRIYTFTQELRLATDLPGPLNFLLGGYYLNEHIHEADQLSYGTQFAPYANLLIEGSSGCFSGAPTCTNLSTVEGELGQALHGDPTYYQNTPGNPNAFFGPGQGSNEQYRLADDSISIFGQADFKVMPRLTLTGGLNYTRDVKHYSIFDQSSDVFSNLPLTAIVNGGIQQAAGAYGPGGGYVAAGQLLPLLELTPLQFNPSVLGVPNALEPGRTSNSNLSFTARATYDVTNHVKFYANASSGFKPASVTLDRDSRPPAALSSQLAVTGYPAYITAIPTYGAAIGKAYCPTGTCLIQSAAYGSRTAAPEKSYNYEIGMKANWGVATLNVAAFREIIKNFQSNNFQGTAFLLANAGQESEWGVELEGQVRPSPELTLNGAVSWYDPKYDSYMLSAYGDLSGYRPADIPRWTINLGAQEDHHFANGDRVILRGAWHYESRVNILDGYSAGITTNPITQQVVSNANSFILAGEYTKLVSEVDASLTYAVHTGVDLMLWTRNMFNQRYITVTFDSPAQAGSISGYPNQPRTFGMTARVKW